MVLEVGAVAAWLLVIDGRGSRGVGGGGARELRLTEECMGTRRKRADHDLPVPHSTEQNVNAPGYDESVCIEYDVYSRTYIYRTRARCGDPIAELHHTHTKTRQQIYILYCIYVCTRKKAPAHMQKSFILFLFFIDNNKNFLL